MSLGICPVDAFTRFWFDFWFVGQCFSLFYSSIAVHGFSVISKKLLKTNSVIESRFINIAKKRI